MRKQRWSKAQKTGVGILSVLIILIIVIVSVIPKTASQQSQKIDSTRYAAIDTAQNIGKTEDVYTKDEAKIVFDSLKNKFIAHQDEFNKITWYTPKVIGKYYPNRRTIYSEVRSDGFINLHSNYYADDWLFHTNVQIKIGDQIFSSPVVETFDPNNRTDNDAGYVWENVVYIDGVDNILAYIAENNSESVKVRFVGRNHYDDVTLSQTDKKALVDSYNLANALKALNN